MRHARTAVGGKSSAVQAMCPSVVCCCGSGGESLPRRALNETKQPPSFRSPSPSPTLHVSTSLPAPNAARARPARRTAAARRLRRRSIRAVTQCSVFSVQWRRRGGVVLWREATGEWPRSVRRHVGRRRVGRRRVERRRVGRHVEWPCPQARQMDDEGGEDGPRAWACSIWEYAVGDDERGHGAGPLDG